MDTNKIQQTLTGVKKTIDQLRNLPKSRDFEKDTTEVLKTVERQIRSQIRSVGEELIELEKRVSELEEDAD